MEKIMKVASEKGFVIFSKSSCCLSYAVNMLFQELGVNPYVYEVDHEYCTDDDDGREGSTIEKALMWMSGSSTPLPAVFIGGKLIGSTNEIMSLHLSGSLLPMLKPYQLQASES